MKYDEIYTHIASRSDPGNPKERAPVWKFEDWSHLVKSGHWIYVRCGLSQADCREAVFHPKPVSKLGNASESSALVQCKTGEDFGMYSVIL